MTIPNILTVIRLLMVGVFYWLFHSNEWIWACIVFVLAGITDLLDGYIARKYNMISNFGKLMDPLADKLMVLTAIFCLWSVHLVPTAVIVIIAVKELAMIAGASFIFGKRKKVVYANWVGKIATACTFAAIVLLFLDPWVRPAGSIVLYIGVAFQVLALVQYAALNLFGWQPKHGKIKISAPMNDREVDK